MIDRIYQLSHYDYAIPEKLIAQQPTDQRSDSRLLVYHSNGDIKHTQFKQLAEYIPKNSLLVFNDSFVFPSRILCQTQTGAKVEVFLLHCTSPTKWECLAKPLKKLRPGKKLIINSQEFARVDSVNDSQSYKTIVIELLPEVAQNLDQWLLAHAHIALPPYIKRPYSKAAQNSEDQLRYQTVYANREQSISQTLGSAAAPTAGLHFDAQVFETLKSKNIKLAKIMLHVGAGTFLPVQTEDIRQHQMHSENFYIPNETLELIDYQRQEKLPIICVGTTSLRTLVGYYNKVYVPSIFEPNMLQTDIFIHPENVKNFDLVADGLITNFHQPKSTLFILICALLGKERATEIYQQAIKKEYRFFSYGDSSLLWLK